MRKALRVLTLVIICAICAGIIYAVLNMMSLKYRPGNISTIPRINFEECRNNGLFIEKVSIENKQDFPKDILFKDTALGISIEKNTPFGFYIVTKKNGSEEPAFEKVPIPEQYKPLFVLANGHYARWSNSPRGTEKAGQYEYGYFWPSVDGPLSLDAIDPVRNNSSQQTSAKAADRLLPVPKDILINLDTFYLGEWEDPSTSQHIVLKIKKSYSKNPDFIPCAPTVMPE